MKSLLLSFLFIMASLPILSQDDYDFTGLQGLKSGSGDILFEVGGYNISVSHLSGDVNSNAVFNSLKDKYSLGDILADYSESQISSANRVVESESEIANKVNEKQNHVLYLVGLQPENITAIHLQTYNQRDIILEQSFVKAFLSNELDSFVSENWSAASIDFVGQEILLGAECRWIKPHHVRCGDAQMVWSEFPSYEEALLDINNRIRIYSNDLFYIVGESDIDVLFEGRPSVAHRVVYQRKEAGDIPYSICYYIVQEIDGRNVSCMLSTPAHRPNDYGLASLLQQVMTIPTLPEDAFEVYETEDDNDKGFVPGFEIQAGTWLPVGRLSNVFSWAPTVGLFIDFPIKNQMSIDFGVQLAFPINRGIFEFKRKGEYYETKGDFFIDISLRWRKYKSISPKSRFSVYLGAGFNAMQTDLERLEYDDESSKYESIYTVDVLGGASIHYGRLGAFIEYHYTPYSIGNKVDSYFGHSSMNMGLSYSFFSR